jgi:bifunctional UDP-N-acetylglucosamine pyrophosphorylase/glucosamine-1-phosphate N-acetyltransferase
MKNNTAVIVMAAGAGTRFKSKYSKLLHNMAGKPVISYLGSLMRKIGPAQTIFVVSFQKEEVVKAIGNGKGFGFVEQKVLDGTAGAVRVALPSLNDDIKKVIIVPGDTPTMPEDIILQLMEDKRKVVVVGTRIEDPTGYGRIKTDKKGLAVKIIEETDVSKADKKIDLVNTSIYCFDRKFLEQTLKDVSKNKNKNEFYLTDVIEIANKSKVAVGCIDYPYVDRVLGPNDRAGLIETSLAVWMERAVNLLDEGVTILDPSRVFIDDEVVVAQDVKINPDVYLTGNTVIEEDVEILEGCRIGNSRIGKGSIVGPYVIIDGAEIGPENKIGPFTYVRPGTKTDRKVKIGGFVETKKISVGEGSKIPHLSYVGDAVIGKNVNIGCGVITCNYDGFKKHLTEIGDNVFVGSDSQLIAPVKLNDDSYVAAGTTVTHEIKKGDLAISRGKQRNIEGYAYKIREKKGVK